VTIKLAALGALVAFFSFGGLAYGQVTLVGRATIDASGAGHGVDLSHLTGSLESSVTANVLGGTGSALAYAGGATFLLLPDRGPNANPYNPAIDDTTSFIARFHTLSITVGAAAPGSSLPLSVTPVLTGTTLLFSPTPLNYGDGNGLGVRPGAPANNALDRYYFTGRSDNFAPGQPSSWPANARLDPEGIRLANDGKSVFVSDEYGPSIFQFDRKTGRRIRSFALPANLAVSHLAQTEGDEIANNTVGRTTNKGMEGLAITPDGTALVGIIQAALLQDAAVPSAKKLVHIVRVDVASGKVEQFGYMLTDGSGASEILAINSHEFLVLERDGAGLGAGSPAVVKKLYRIDLQGAKRIDGLDGAAAAAAAVPKTLVLDIVKELGAHGVAAAQIPSKIEGIAFGPDASVGRRRVHTLYVANDNDFRPDTSGPNQIFIFGFTDADLPGYTPQTLVK